MPKTLEVKVLGHRVELEEIDAHLREVGACDAAAVAWPIEHGSALGIVGFLSGSTLSPTAIKQSMKERLPAYMVPQKIISLEAMPLNANGKISRSALAAMLEDGLAASTSPDSAA